MKLKKIKKAFEELKKEAQDEARAEVAQVKARERVKRFNDVVTICSLLVTFAGFLVTAAILALVLISC